jgi:hypothetical protein
MRIVILRNNEVMFLAPAGIAVPHVKDFIKEKLRTEKDKIASWSFKFVETLRWSDSKHELVEP